MAGPTQALVSLHGAGRNDTYGAALLDVAQDHLLWLLDQQGLFESGWVRCDERDRNPGRERDRRWRLPGTARVAKCP